MGVQIPSALSKNTSGPFYFYCNCDFRFWTALWQLPERVYLPLATRPVGCDASFRLSALQRTDRFLRQHAGLELVDFARTLPQLQSPDFAALLDD